MRKHGKTLFARTVEKLIPIIRSVRPCRDEKKFQGRIERAIRSADVSFSEFGREVACGKGKVDFLVDGVLVEIKTNGSPLEAARQAIKYCQARPEAVGALIVHTRGEAPKLETIGTKPIQFLNVAFSSL